MFFRGDMEKIEKIITKIEMIKDLSEELKQDKEAQCKLCNDTGWIFKKDYTLQRCTHLEAENFINTQKSIESFLDELRVGMPERFKPDQIPQWDLELISYEYQKIMLNKIQELSQGQRSNIGLFLYGPPGDGKTYSVCFIINSLVEPRIMHCAFFNYPRLLAAIRDNFHNYDVLDRLKELLFETDLIALDDLGMERKVEDPDTSWSIDLLYQVIDYRCDNFKPVLITSNRDPDELEDQIKKGIWSRIRGMCDIHKMPADDLRHLKKDEK
ncbi:MAG: ATP-binding protein [Candidatus Hydrogenedentota bacterium]